MPKMTRRALLASAGAVALVNIRTRPANAAEFTYKYANNSVLTHPLTIRAMEAAEAIKQESGGRMEIQVFPNNQLGGDTDMLSQVRSGAIDFFSLSGLILATLVPAASINGVGFAFKDYGQVWAAMDGPLGNYVRAQIQKAGLVAMDTMWDNGYRQITSSTRPILTPADLKGFKIRVPPSPLWTSMFKAFDAAPTSINFAETYSALQTKVVEGQENPLAIINAAKLFEVQKSLSVTNHMWDGFHILANRRSWERLPADLKTIVAKHWNAAGMRQREDIFKLNNSLEAELTQKGLQFHRVNADEFREALRKAGFYEEWKGRYGAEAWDILEKSVGKIA
ncbi:MAG: TRAP transporter substrate-binding protein [Elsteraceae bacterium]